MKIICSQIITPAETLSYLYPRFHNWFSMTPVIGKYLECLCYILVFVQPCNNVNVSKKPYKYKSELKFASLKLVEYGIRQDY